MTCYITDDLTFFIIKEVDSMLMKSYTLANKLKKPPSKVILPKEITVDLFNTFLKRLMRSYCFPSVTPKPCSPKKLLGLALIFDIFGFGEYIYEAFDYFFKGCRSPEQWNKFLEEIKDKDSPSRIVVSKYMPVIIFSLVRNLGIFIKVSSIGPKDLHSLPQMSPPLEPIKTSGKFSESLWRFFLESESICRLPWQVGLMPLVEILLAHDQLTPEEALSRIEKDLENLKELSLSQCTKVNWDFPCSRLIQKGRSQSQCFQIEGLPLFLSAHWDDSMNQIDVFLGFCRLFRFTNRTRFLVVFVRDSTAKNPFKVRQKSLIFEPNAQNILLKTVKIKASQITNSKFRLRLYFKEEKVISALLEWKRTSYYKENQREDYWTKKTRKTDDNEEKRPDSKEFPLICMANKVLEKDLNFAWFEKNPHFNSRISQISRQFLMERILAKKELVKKTEFMRNLFTNN